MSDFHALDRILGVENVGALDRKRPFMEDQWAANQIVGDIYGSIGLKAPKYCWAKSPRVIHEAIELLRNIHVGERHKFIEAMIPYDSDVLRRESQKTLLEALIDRDVSVTMGANLYPQMPYSGRARYSLGRLPSFLEHALQPRNLGRRTAPAGWSDACMYSVGFESKVLQEQTFCVLAYKAIAWMCSPGKKTETDEATVWTWGDGYKVVLKHEKKEEPLTLDGDSIPRMQASNMKQLPEGTK